MHSDALLTLWEVHQASKCPPGLVLQPERDLQPLVCGGAQAALLAVLRVQFGLGIP